MKCPLTLLGARPLPPGWTGYVLDDVPCFASGGRPLVVCAELDDLARPSVEVEATDCEPSSILAATVSAVDEAWSRWQRTGDPDDVPLPPGWTLSRGVCDCGGPLWTAQHARGRETRSDRVGEVVRVAWLDYTERTLGARVVGVGALIVIAAALMAFGALALAVARGWM